MASTSKYTYLDIKVGTEVCVKQYTTIKEYIQQSYDRIIKLESNSDRKLECVKIFNEIFTNTDDFMDYASHYKNYFLIVTPSEFITSEGKITAKISELRSIFISNIDNENSVLTNEYLATLLNNTLPSHINNLITETTVIYGLVNNNLTARYSTLISKDDVKLTIPELTDGDVVGTIDSEEGLIWKGTGTIDILLEVVNKNIKMQFDSGRITPETFAQVYTTLMMEAIKQGINILGLTKDNLLKWQASANKDVLDKLNAAMIKQQIKTYERQLKGFDDHMYLKLCDAQANAFSTMFASGLLDGSDTGPFSSQNLNKMWNKAADRAESNASATFDIDERISKPESMIFL